MSGRNKETTIVVSLIVICVVLAVLAFFGGLILVDTCVTSEGGRIIGNVLIMLVHWGLIFALLRG